MRLPLLEIRALDLALPHVHWHDVTSLVHQLRHTKSEPELRRLRDIAVLVSQLYNAVPDIAQTGMGEIELFRRLRQYAHGIGIDEVPYRDH